MPLQESEAPPMDKERIFVVVLGTDQRGLIARISTLLYDHDCNIEDLQQKVMDGTFVMTMLADVTGCKQGIKELRTALEKQGEEMGLTIMVQNEAVLKAMQRV
ncbi:ACT domain-containing protein [Dethiosulfatarculus sandiegensis]|uniref:ACT domain-containing protein n=1 Tax=Dethiosulfatarculus sandiegensis TaxID=1429043 RepID=UPI0018D167AC|nr:ACT domain-containing protein [Dethiosulfatarculus sandiegensis]